MRINNPNITHYNFFEKFNNSSKSFIIYDSSTFLPQNKFLQENGVEMVGYSLIETIEKIPLRKLIELYYKLDK